MSIESEWEEIVDRCDSYNERLSNFMVDSEEYLTDYNVLKSAVNELKEIWKTTHSSEVIQNNDIALAKYGEHKNKIYLNLVEYGRFEIGCTKKKVYPDRED